MTGLLVDFGALSWHPAIRKRGVEVRGLGLERQRARIEAIPIQNTSFEPIPC